MDEWPFLGSTQLRLTTTKFDTLKRVQSSVIGLRFHGTAFSISAPRLLGESREIKDCCMDWHRGDMGLLRSSPLFLTTHHVPSPPRSHLSRPSPQATRLRSHMHPVGPFTIRGWPASTLRSEHINRDPIRPPSKFGPSLPSLPFLVALKKE